MRRAMDYISELVPCITFVQATSSSPNYVTITPGSGCKSERGMRGGGQLLYMNASCFKKGLILPVHELMHTLGFVHEHNRTLVLAMAWFAQDPKQTFFDRSCRTHWVPTLLWVYCFLLLLQLWFPPHHYKATFWTAILPRRSEVNEMW